MYTHIWCICLYTQIYQHMVYTYTYTYVMRMYVCVYICMHICKYTIYTYLHKYMVYLHKYMHTLIYLYMVHVYILYMYTCHVINTDTHTHTPGPWLGVRIPRRYSFPTRKSGPAHTLIIPPNCGGGMPGGTILPPGGQLWPLVPMATPPRSHGEKSAPGDP